MGREEDCEELSLELSIGGKYGKKYEESGEKPRDFCGNGENLNPSCDFDELMMDPQRRREIHASRRQEARRKREEKVRKSRGNVNAAGFVDDRSFLEEQKFRGRAGDREIRENDCFSEGKTRKNFKEDCSRSDELGLSLFSEKECVLYPKVQLAEGKSSASVNLSDSDNGVKSSEQCSSAVSDYRSNSQKGGSNSDTGCSHPSPFRQRHPGAADQVDSFDRSAKLAPKRSPSEEGTAPEARSSNNAARLPQMPCVSATGNGPNGTTVTGFLYRYSTTEVSIVCVCHGSSFSPAEFVKHAGGVDVSHPLRHITVVTRCWWGSFLDLFNSPQILK